MKKVKKYNGTYVACFHIFIQNVAADFYLCVVNFKIIYTFPKKKKIQK